MDRKRSASKLENLTLNVQVLLVFVLIWTVHFSSGDTNPDDAAALQSLYTALGAPTLPGWLAGGGDPCGEAWQGVQCNGSNIVSIVLNGANLGGELGESLGSFASVVAIDLSNNHIGGNIPSSLPANMQHLFLSDNQFTGNVPTSLSTLTQLTDMSLNDNQLTGEIPDAFQSLSGLINLDLSNNNLNGELPPSLENLLALTTLHLQNNQLSGTLDVLQDIHLTDLNIENNKFAGPIPQKLLGIPNFRKDGNLFNVVNSTIAPVPSRSPGTFPPASPISGAPPVPRGSSSEHSPTTKPEDASSGSAESNSLKSVKSSTTKKLVWISIAGGLLFITFLLVLALYIPRFKRRKREVDTTSKQHRIGAYEADRQNPGDNKAALVQPTKLAEKELKNTVPRPKRDHQSDSRRTEAITKPQNEKLRNVERIGIVPKKEDHKIDMSSLDVYLAPPPLPPPPPPQHVERLVVEPSLSIDATNETPSRRSAVPLTTAKSFTIASLQQYTNSFSEENLIGAGMLGTVYRAQLPDGKLLAIKKLDKRASSQQKDEEFIELVDSIDGIRHANVVELIGYCAEHGQRLLIYEYCSNGTLYDALHSDDDFRKKLSWNTRIRIALGAARALEYLHEVCQPPIVHRNFKSTNILLDDDLSGHVSDCGLAPLTASGAVSQLSGQLLAAYGYGAPEYESGIYTYQSDVYSFGVVMLELLTGRMSYDRTRPRGEQFLVRWAIPRLHDIDALTKMVDPSLSGQHPTKPLSNFADIISRCVQSEPEFRPPMSEIVQDLLDMMKRERYGSESD